MRTIGKDAIVSGAALAFWLGVSRPALRRLFDAGVIAQLARNRFPLRAAATADAGSSVTCCKETLRSPRQARDGSEADADRAGNGGYGLAAYHGSCEKGDCSDGRTSVFGDRIKSTQGMA